MKFFALCFISQCMAYSLKDTSVKAPASQYRKTVIPMAMRYQKHYRVAPSTAVSKQLMNTFSKPLRAALKVEAIVGGTKVSKSQIREQFGWFALLTSGQSNCGGVMIAPGYLLTAAHCSAGPIASKSATLYADNAYNREMKEAIQLRITKVIIHEDYDPKKLINDIAIWKVEARRNLANLPIRFVSLSTKKLPSKIQAVGFGKTGIWYDFSKQLHQVDLNVVPEHELNGFLQELRLGGLSEIKGKIFATRQEGDARRDVAEGDSGGGVFTMEEDGTASLFGIVSGGLPERSFNFHSSVSL